MHRAQYFCNLGGLHKHLFIEREFEELECMAESQARFRNGWYRPVRRILFATTALRYLCFSSGRAQAQGRSTEELRKMDQSMGELIRKVSPSVVQILVSGYGQVEESEHGNTGGVIGRQRAIGSGFIIDSSGYIVTNAHVVKGAQRVQVVLSSPNSDDFADAVLSAKTSLVPARIIGVTSEIDLALLKVDVVGLRALKLASYRNLRQG